MESPLLPDDILRKIVKYCPRGTAYAFSLASKKCNTFFWAHYKNIKWIEELEFYGASEDELMIEMKTSFDKELDRQIHLIESPSRHVSRTSQVTYTFKVKYDVPFLISLRKLIGPSLTMMRMKNLSDSQWDLVSRHVLRGVELMSLHVQQGEMSDDDGDRLLNYVVEHDVESLIIEVLYTQISDPRAFLLQLGAHVKSLEIRQMKNFGFIDSSKRIELNSKSKYLFGMWNLDWVSLICELIEGGVKEIKILNELVHFTEVNDAHRLVQAIAPLSIPCSVHSTFGADLTGQEFSPAEKMKVEWTDPDIYRRRLLVITQN